MAEAVQTNMVSTKTPKACTKPCLTGWDASAIRSDNNGSFVLAISQKSSPLGNRYIAKRVSIEVLASDDNNSAVVADLGNGDYVITTGSGPIKNGDQVRMADSSEG